MEIAINQEMESNALAIVDQAHLVLVVDNESMEKANQFNLDIRQAIKDIEAWFDPMVKKAHEAHRALTARRSETLKPLEEASAFVTGQVKAYLKKIREEEEREAARLREEARRQAEEEQLARALDAEQSGNADEANEILETAPVYVAPVPVVDRPKVDGRLYKTTTKVKVINRVAFLSNVKPETLLECLTEQAWQGIEAGLARKARALGKAFKLSGCQVQEI